MQQLDARRHWELAHELPSLRAAESMKFYLVMPSDIYMGWHRCLNEPALAEATGREFPEKQIRPSLYENWVATCLSGEVEK